MHNNKIRWIGAGVLAAVWLGLTVLAWVNPAKETSEAERRPLAQFPEVSGEALMSGKFVADFEDYTLDQFPGRDLFRTLKSLVAYNVLGQQDNNGIYLSDGYAAKQEYPLDEGSVTHALSQFQLVYEKYLKDNSSKVISAVIPDKGYYLAEKTGHLAMDYEKMLSMVEAGMPWATHVDLTEHLSLQDYYFTDTHWRQEQLLPAAGALSQALGVTAPKAEDFRKTLLDRPFYGVYYGQAALPMDPEELFVMNSQLLSDCKVYNHTTGQYTPVYDLDKLTGKDPYEVYLSGSQSLLTIENPNAPSGRELIIFRDSFGSSIAPLLVQEYAKVTLVDIRYLNANFLDRYLEFNGQDVLFLYSTLVLNSKQI